LEKFTQAVAIITVPVQTVAIQLAIQTFLICAGAIQTIIFK